MTPAGMSYITFNGVSSRTLDLYIKQEPNREIPKKSLEKATIPGRNGTIYYDNGKYENVTCEYEISLYNPSYVVTGQTQTEALAERLINWLNPTKGYCRLTDSYDTLHYRKAICSNPDKLELQLQQVGSSTLKFDCMPQRYLTSGETPFEISAGATSYTYTNPTPNDALPLIYIPGGIESDVTFTFTASGCDTLRLIVSNSYDGFYIDCETMEVYRYISGVKTSCIAALSADSDFPILYAGKTTTITLSTALDENVEVTPNTWVL